MKNFKRILALVLAAMMVVTGMVTIGAADLTTTASGVTYNETAITRLAKLDIFKGYTNGSTGAADNVTREQMALFTGRVITGKTATNYWEAYENDTTFKDISGESAEYVGAIAYAFEEGIVVGKSDVRFDPKGNVSYQDALTMVVRSLGYTGLSYPNGYINKAIKLGLTAGIDGVAYKDAAIRGVIATILYNALYAEDSLFASNFDLSSGTYMLVATPAKTTASGLILDAPTINGYVGKKINAGFVAFAPIGENNRPVNAGYVYAKTSQLDADFDVDFANRLGYAYTITFEGEEIAWADQCATTVFQNYGDDRDITKTTIKYKDNNNVVQTESFLTFGNQAYNLVDATDFEHTAPTTTRDLILYTGSAPVTLNEYQYLYDADLNLVDNNGNVLLYYKNGEYYAEKNGKYVLATDDDLDAALQVVACQTTSRYNILTQNSTVGAVNVVKSLTDNYFCEISAMDYDGDGVYDAAIYVPYYVGRFNGLTAVAGADGKSTKKTSISGGLAVTIADIRDYTVTGALSEATAWKRMIYTVNELNNEIRVIETLNNINSKVVWASKGAPVNGVYTNSQVKFANGSTYKIGGWTDANLCGINVISRANAFEVSTRNQNLEDGWDDLFLEAMKSTYSTCNAYAVAGHVIWAWPVAASATYSYDFVAFDPWASEFSVVNGNQIVVDNALTDTTGERKTVTINSVEGETFGNIEYQAFVNYIDALYGANADIIKYSYYFNEALRTKMMATKGYQVALRSLVWDQFLAATDDYTAFAPAGAYEGFTQFYGVAGTTNGGYDLLVFDQADGYATTTAVGTVTFTLGVADNYFCTATRNSKLAVAKAYIATNDKTVFTIIGADGVVTYTGKPKDGYKLVLTADTKVYCANSDAIMLVDETRLVEDIAVGDTTWTTKFKDKDSVVFTYDFVDTWAFNEYKAAIPSSFVNPETYLITSKTANKEIYRDSDDTPVYTYTNLYDLAAQKYVDVVFVGDDAEIFDEALNVLNGTHDIKANVGTIITRDDEGNMVAYKLADYADAANGNIFNLVDDEVKFDFGTYTASDKDNNGQYAHVTISGVKYTVRNVNFIVVTKNAADVVNDFSKITANAAVYFVYNAKTGDLTGYAFNK